MTVFAEVNCGRPVVPRLLMRLCRAKEGVLLEYDAKQEGNNYDENRMQQRR